MINSILILFLMIPAFTFGATESNKCKSSFNQATKKTTTTKKKTLVATKSEEKKQQAQEKKTLATTKSEEKKKQQVQEKTNLAIKKEVTRVITDMFSISLILPRTIDLVKNTDYTHQEIEAAIGPKITKEFWDDVVKKNPNYFKNIKTSIARAFIRSFTTNNSKWSNITPTVERLWEIYLRMYAKNNTYKQSKFNINFRRLRYLLGQHVPPSKLTRGYTPIFFPNGLKDVEAIARVINEKAFKNYVNIARFGYVVDVQIADLIKHADGFLVTSVTAEIPVDREFFDNMRFYASQKNYLILVMPTNGITDGIDPYILNKKGVFSLTSTTYIINSDIELSPYLRLWTIPVMPKNENPDASLDKPLQGRKNQVQIIASPQLRYKGVPTAENKNFTHAIWSTGSISKNLYPFNNPASGRVSNLANNRHQLSFLVVEKTDKKSGVFQKGSPGMYHIRPVKYYDHKEHGGRAGFTDMGYFYSDGKREKADVHTIVVGDIHDHSTSQYFLQVVEDAMTKFNIKNIILHDVLDGFSHNHHESKRLVSKLNKYKKGELNIQDEVEGVIQTLNAFLDKFPRLTMFVNDSNHHYWLENLMDDPNAISDMQNREFIIELLSARTEGRGRNIYEYLFNSYREDYHKNLMPYELSIKKQKDSIYISQPERIKVMGKHETFLVGPDHNPVHLNFHGHKGGNGARGSPLTHARASDNIVVGDSHSPVILGGYVNVGVAMPKEVPYTEGGYSSWQNAFAFINEETGDAQLILYEPKTGRSWYQNLENGTLPLKEWYDVKVTEKDNSQLPPGTKIIDQYTRGSFEGKK